MKRSISNTGEIRATEESSVVIDLSCGVFFHGANGLY